MMGLDLYRSLWDDPEITAIALALAPAWTPTPWSRSWATGWPVCRERSKRSEYWCGPTGATGRGAERLRPGVCDHGALQLLAALVAFIGVLSALLSLQLERGRELGLMRAIGLTAAQCAAWCCWRPV